MAKFNNGFGGGNMQSMLRQAQKLQEEIQKAQQTLNESEYVGMGGGDMVTVTMKGDKTLVSISIKPEVVDPDDVEMLEDLISAAFVDVYDKIEEATQKIMGPYSGMLGGGLF